MTHRVRIRGAESETTVLVIIGDSSDQSKEGRMEAGQVVTLEPAFYEPEKYGVRIGSCYETVLTQSSRTSGNPFLCFQVSL